MARFSGSRFRPRPDDPAYLEAVRRLDQDDVARADSAPERTMKEKTKREAIEDAKERARQRAREKAEEFAARKRREDKEDGLDDLVELKMRQERERKAAEEELRAQRERALMEIDAKAGLAGLGLSGAGSALKNDAGRVRDRSDTLALAELDRQHRTEQFTQLQRAAALADLEDALDQDLDGDGKVNNRAVGDGIGDGDPETDPVDPKAVGEAREQLARVTLEGEGTASDPYSGPLEGGLQLAILEGLVAGGVTFELVRVETGIANREKYVIAKGSDGKFYKFKQPGTGWAYSPSDQETRAWFESVT